MRSGSFQYTDPRYAETYFIPSGDRECDYLRAVLTQGSYTVKATENSEITSDADARGFHASLHDPMLTVYEYTDGKLTAYYSVHPNGRFSVTRAGSDETLFSESVLEEKDIALLYANTSPQRLRRAPVTSTIPPERAMLPLPTALKR